MKGDSCKCCDNCAWAELINEQDETGLHKCYFDGAIHGFSHSCDFFIDLKEQTGITGAAVERLKNRIRELSNWNTVKAKGATND